MDGINLKSKDWMRAGCKCWMWTEWRFGFDGLRLDWMDENTVPCTRSHC